MSLLPIPLIYFHKLVKIVACANALWIIFLFQRSNDYLVFILFGAVAGYFNPFYLPEVPHIVDILARLTSAILMIAAGHRVRDELFEQTGGAE